MLETLQPRGLTFADGQEIFPEPGFLWSGRFHRVLVREYHVGPGQRIHRRAGSEPA
jgi:hypothetical protein